MSAIDSLPVAPEFCAALKENASKTALECLKALCVPEQIIALVEGISDLGYYLEVCYSQPEAMQGPANRRFDIEAVVIDTINAIAKTGGTFEGPYTVSRPRPFHPRRLQRAKKHAEEMA